MALVDCPKFNFFTAPITVDNPLKVGDVVFDRIGIVKTVSCINTENGLWAAQYADRDWLSPAGVEHLNRALIHEVSKKALGSFNGTACGSSCGLLGRLVDWLNESGNFDIEVLTTYWPNIDKHDTNKVHAWIDAKGRGKEGRTGRTEIRLGKLLRKMNHLLSDTHIEQIVDAFRQAFSVSDLKICSGLDRKSFCHAYTHTQAPMENPATNLFRKNISTSCMRVEQTKSLNCHPSEAYASGDFQIFWTEDSAGLIHSRAVALVKDGINKFAPIYGVSESAIDRLQNHLYILGFSMQSDSDVIGFKLLINYHDEHEGTITLPYIDIGVDRAKRIDDHLVISEYGEFDLGDSYGNGWLFSEHGGKANNCTCYECDEQINAEDSYTDGNSYCESCYTELFVFCEHCGETVRSDGSETVYVGRYNCGQTWGEFAVRDHATYLDHRQEYWCTELTQTDGNGDSFCEKDIEEGNWYYCGQTEEYWPESEIVECIVDSESEEQSVTSVNYTWAIQNGYTAIANGAYFKPEEQTEDQCLIDLPIEES